MPDAVVASLDDASELRRPLDELEQRLLIAAWRDVPNRGYGAFSGIGWRTRQSIDEELLVIPDVDERSLARLYADLPRLPPELLYGHGYGLIWYQDMGTAPRPDAPILLTLAGLARLAELDGTSAAHARRTLERLFPAIAELGEAKKGTPGLGNSDPTGTPLGRYLGPVVVPTREWISPVPIDVVATILRTEYGNPFNIVEQADGWRIHIPRSDVTGWRNVRDVQAYWSHLEKVVTEDAHDRVKQAGPTVGDGTINHIVNTTHIHGGQNNVAVGNSGAVEQNFTAQEVPAQYQELDAALAQILERIDQLSLTNEDRELLTDQAQAVQREVRSSSPVSKVITLGRAAITTLLSATLTGVGLAVTADTQAWLEPLIKQIHP